MTAAPALPPFQAAVEMLRLRGIVLRQLPGAYSVNFRNGAAASEYRTDALADAVAHALAMGEAPANEPPLGPMGKRMTRRGKMIAHNRKIAARRRRRDASKSAVQTEGEINS
jgi:hypothetical protein